MNFFSIIVVFGLFPSTQQYVFGFRLPEFDGRGYIVENGTDAQPVCLLLRDDSLLRFLLMVKLGTSDKLLLVGCALSYCSPCPGYELHRDGFINMSKN